MPFCSRVCTHIALALLSLSSVAQAGGGPLGIDQRLTLDDHGIWARKVQLGLLGTMVATEGAVALWEGGDSRLGKTAWQSLDATLVGGVAVEIAKLAFSRERPLTTDNPTRWFTGHGNASFPSGEATLTTAIVTPMMLEYGRDHPAVYGLALLPAYDAIARVKTRGHWQSDVLAGIALGGFVGYEMHERNVPLTLSVLPDGFHAGFKARW